jgi:heme A synthase
MKMSRYAKYVWVVLAVNLLVILWGAVVRATGSGAGCGAHWPLCNGEVVPTAPQVETLVELFHRLTSGFALILVVVMLIGAFRAYPKGHPVRAGAVLSMIFMLLESLVGAFIVLMRLTGNDTSVGRAFIIAVHQVNTLLLIGAITLTGWWAMGGGRIRLRGQGALTFMLVSGLIGMFIIGATGAITALGDTLFPATSLVQGLEQKFDPTANFMVRLRIVHPTLAVIMAIYVTVLAQYVARRAGGETARRAARLLLALFFGQLVLGAINVALLAPVWMQLVHLLMADMVWIAFVLLSASALSATQAEVMPATLDARAAGAIQTAQPQARA